MTVDPGHRHSAILYVPGYLAALLGGLKTAHGLSQFEAYGKYAEFVEGDGDGDKSVQSVPRYFADHLATS